MRPSPRRSLVRGWRLRYDLVAKRSELACIYSSDRRCGPKNNTTDCHSDMILTCDPQEEKPRRVDEASKSGLGLTGLRKKRTLEVVPWPGFSERALKAVR